MQFKILNIENLVYVAADSSSINCSLVVEGRPDKIPFTASSQDPETHGREIYAAIVAGQYGPIGPYVPPPPLKQPKTTGTQSV
jgi:hypothetical protein